MNKEELLNRINYLDRIIRKTQTALKNTPEGTLRINHSHRGQYVQYYHRLSASERRGKYLKKEQRDLINRLAQKDYETKLLNAALQEKAAIETYINLCPEIIPEEVYEQMNQDRQQLVIPEIETDDMFRRRWESIEYKGKEISDDCPEQLTDKGERVRSKSEVLIANQLAREDIPYRYEYPITLTGMGTVYPDFTILNIKSRKEIYWEHQGMMDDPEYAERAVRKEACYIRNGIIPGDNLILTSETRQNPINSKQIRAIITKFCR